MYYGNIKKYDIADGEGVRVTLFVSGCTNHCKGCFQKETWDFCYGTKYTSDTEKEILEALGSDFIQGLTLLGGEPFEPENQRDGRSSREDSGDAGFACRDAGAHRRLYTRPGAR